MRKLKCSVVCLFSLALAANGAEKAPVERKVQIKQSSPSAGKAMKPMTDGVRKLSREDLFEAARSRLVDIHIDGSTEKGKRRLASDSNPPPGISKDVLDAVRQVPRHRFVPGNLLNESYEDKTLNVGFGRKMDSPVAIAARLDALKLEKTDRVLELGTGPGYQTALLSKLAGKVVSVESDERSFQIARADLKRLPELKNIDLVRGPLEAGVPSQGPYDVVVVNRLGASIPESIVSQLRMDGRLAQPIEGNARFSIMRKTEDGMVSDGVRLVQRPGHKVSNTVGLRNDAFFRPKKSSSKTVSRSSADAVRSQGVRGTRGKASGAKRVRNDE